MSTKFTEKAENALNRAVRIAEGYGHTYVGSEHIMFALSEDEGCCASSILRKRNVTAQRLDIAIKKSTGLGHQTKLSSKDTTPRCRHILEASYKTAKKYLSDKIGTEHLLFAVLAETESVAEKLLFSIGADITALRDDVLIFFKSSSLVSELATGESNIPIPNLTKYGTNMTLVAERDEYDPVIGRDAETERLIRILARKSKNNPCLIGDAGVGKTAIVEGLARRIAIGDVPPSLKNKILISIDLSSMIAGAKYRGDFEDRIKNILGEAERNKSVILFIDEIHTIVGAGSAEGAIDAANIMKPSLSRGNIRVIGATTISEYRKYIEKDAALERRFQPLMIKEPTELETIEILGGIKAKYEGYHGVEIDDEALVSCVKFSKRYINERYFPDKAIDLLDEACALEASSRYKTQNTNNNTGQSTEIDLLCEGGENGILHEGYSDRADDANALLQENTIINTAFSLPSFGEEITSDKGARPRVSAMTIERVVTELYGGKMLASNLSPAMLQASLNGLIFGQTKAVADITVAISKNMVGMTDESRPRGIFLFIGESGVGKTQLAKSLSIELFGDLESLIEVDMSEFSESSSVTKLIGSAPGYVGYDDGNSIIEKIKRKPYSVVLLDEIDKAHRDVLGLFLQVFDNGYITDSTGRRVNFRNAYIVMTANLRQSQDISGIGFVGKNEGVSLSGLTDVFTKEFLNRIDAIIPFSPLGIDALSEIARRMLADKKEQYYEKIGLKLDFEDNVCEAIAYLAKKEGGGARPLKRIVSSKIDCRVAELISEGKAGSGDEIIVFCDTSGSDNVIKVAPARELVASK